jgi:hypothetical protein
MARAVKQAKTTKAPKAARAKKPKARKMGPSHDAPEPRDASGVRFDEDGPVYTKKLTPEELTSMAIELATVAGHIDTLEAEEARLKEQAKFQSQTVRQHLKAARAKLSKLGREFRLGEREEPAQAELPGTDAPKKPALTVVPDQPFEGEADARLPIEETHGGQVGEEALIDPHEDVDTRDSQLWNEAAPAIDAEVESAHEREVKETYLAAGYFGILPEDVTPAQLAAFRESQARATAASQQPAPVAADADGDTVGF